MQFTRLLPEGRQFLPLRRRTSNPGMNPNAVDSFARREKLKRACEDFEALFIYQLLKAMRSTLPKDKYLGGGIGQGVFFSLLDQHLSQKISQAEPLGIAQMLYRKLRQQVVRSSEIEGKAKAISPVSGGPVERANYSVNRNDKSGGRIF